MHLLSLIVATMAAARLTAAYLVAPPDTAFPGASSDCSAWMYASTDSLTCEEVEAKYNITLTQFATWNPLLFELSATCVILAGYDYCVEVNFESTTSSSTTTTDTSTTTSTSTSLHIPTPTADIATYVADCTSFHNVTSIDNCTSIASSAGITLAELYTWNPFVGPDCDWLNEGMELCTSMNGTASTSLSTGSTSATTTKGGDASSMASPTDTTSSGNAITTPAPIQTGMVAHCDEFYLIVSGDSCGTVAANHDISLADFYAWNPAVGSSCAYLVLGDYVCVGVIGASTAVTDTTAPTTTGNGITTPSPIQSGMVSSCNSFYLVKSGDTCAAIAEDQGVSLSDFYAWNPAVGTSCLYLGLGDYVCVGTIGSVSSSSSTTTGNGITTPTPTQTGMVSNCNQFYYVDLGDGCASIAAAEGVTVAELEQWNPAVGDDCSSLWANTYLCIGVS